MIWSLLCSLISAFKTRRSLALENLALRQQLAVLQRSVKRPQLSNVDRGMWVLLYRVWTEWASVLVIVKPETVVRWHRTGFKHYWTWKSRRHRLGRPGVAPEVRELIRDMCRANPLWEAPRVHGELRKRLENRVNEFLEGTPAGAAASPSARCPRVVMENLALRQQVTALKKERPRPMLGDTDRRRSEARSSNPVLEQWPNGDGRLTVWAQSTVRRYRRPARPRYNPC